MTLWLRKVEATKSYFSFVLSHLFSSAQLQHPLYRLERLAGGVGIHRHLGPSVLQRVVDLEQGVHLHVFTLVAPAVSAGLRRHRQKPQAT